MNRAATMPSAASPKTRSGVRPEPLRRRRAVQPQPTPSQWRRRALHYLLVFVIVVLVVDGLVGESGLQQSLRNRAALSDQQRALEAIRQENQRLRNDIRRLRDDPRTIEALAREELGLIRPGEVLFIVRDVKTPPR